MSKPTPPRPEKIRKIESTFGWIDHRLKDFLPYMSQEEILLYFFLSMAANEQGCSYHSVRHITKSLKMSPTTLMRAREMLEERGMIATEKDELSQRIIYQVLPLPIERINLDIPIIRNVSKTTKKNTSGDKQSAASGKNTESAESPEEMNRIWMEQLKTMMKNV